MSDREVDLFYYNNLKVMANTSCMEVAEFLDMFPIGCDRKSIANSPTASNPYQILSS